MLFNQKNLMLFFSLFILTFLGHELQQKTVIKKRTFRKLIFKRYFFGSSKPVLVTDDTSTKFK